MATGQHQQTREGQTYPENDQQPTGSETETENQQISPLSQRGVTGGTYERNPVNNLSLGPAFEANVAIYSMLTLRSDQQELAFEYKTAPAKFDDVVLRVWNGNQHDYYYCQLKHRDTDQDPDACLTWDDLLTPKKSKFGIPFYYESLAQPRPTALKDVKALIFVTNYHLVKRPGKANNLESLAKHFFNPPRKSNQAKHYITGSDLSLYFQECHDQSMWRAPSTNQKSFRFTAKAIDDIFNGTQAAGKLFDLSVYKEYLGLLVFRVSMPHVNELQSINQQLLKVFLPFYKNMLQDQYEHIKEEFMQLFRPVTNPGAVNTSGQSCTAEWATVERRQAVLEKLTGHLKAVGSREDETDISELLDFERRSLGEIPLWFRSIFNDMLTEPIICWSERNPLQIVNIYSEESNATMLTLNVLSTLKNSSCCNTYAWQRQSVRDEADIKKEVAYFKELENEISEYKDLIETSFFYVIEVSPSFHPADKADENVKELAQGLMGLKEIRKWIKFVIVTQSSISLNAQLEDFESVKGAPLTWDDLTEDGKKSLLEKTMYLENDIQTSLKKLGFKQGTIGEWLNTKSLAELIIHDKKRPLSLGLPKRDLDLETDYIEREVQLPFLTIDKRFKIAQQIAYDEEEYRDETKNFLLLGAPERDDKYLLVKSKENSSFLKIRSYVTRSQDSDVKIPESKLLEDDIVYGTGSKDNKLIVVVDLPGKGKSCLLTSISNRFLDEWDKQSNHCLLLRVDLLRIKDWETYEDRPIDLFFRHSLVTRANSEAEGNELNFSIVKEKCLNAPEPSVFVLLDGFDEISDKQRETTLKMVDCLLNAKGIKRIILTSRPENTLERELEQHFHQFSLHLKNFDSKDQINYLTKRWGADLKKRNRREASEEKMKIFIETLVDYAQVALKDEDRTFLEIPLQCMILSTCFYAQLEEYLDSELEPEFDNENFKILSLYNRFYDVKFDVLFEEKAELHSKNEASVYIKSQQMERFLKSLMRLSVFHIMTEIGDAQVLCCRNWEDYRKQTNVRGRQTKESEYSEDLIASMKLGLVQGSSDETPLSELEPRSIKFLHRTFAEYFSASFFARHLIQTKSKLFDKDAFLREEVLEKSLEIFSQKVLAAAEYAGVRRFLDRMLAEHLPPVGERCPFAKETSRESVIAKWPVIGHGAFNKHFANLIQSKMTIALEKLQKVDMEKVNIFEILKQCSSPSVKSGQQGLDVFLQSTGYELPSLTLMLLHCFKEYAGRADTTDTDRAILARFPAMISINWIQGHTWDDSVEGLVSSAFHILDRVPELTHAANDLFSKRLFKLINDLIDDTTPSTDGDKRLEAIALTCEMLKEHRDAREFDENLKRITCSIFQEKADGATKADQFFTVELSGSRDCASTKGDTLRRILGSIRELEFSESHLLTQLAVWFAAKLAEQNALANDEHGLFEHYFTSAPMNEYSVDAFELEVKAMAKRFLHPIALEETIEFLAENWEIVQSATLLNESLNSYIDKALRLLEDTLFRTDAEVLMRLGSEFESMDNFIVNAKISANFLLFWHYQLIGKAIGSLSDNEKIKKQLVLNKFVNELGRKCLIAFANAGCCCECEDFMDIGLGIHFPYEMYEYEEPIKIFNHCFADKLRVIWEERGEIEFIDYLLKEQTVSFSEQNENPTEITIETGIRFEESSHSVLNGVHLAKLPCLIFSDLVNEYIPLKLSSAGLQHLVFKLQKTPVFVNKSKCFSGIHAGSLVITDTKQSLWDGIMQDETTPYRILSCQSDKINAFREKFDMMKQCDNRTEGKKRFL